jgi:hypothetical protein
MKKMIVLAALCAAFSISVRAQEPVAKHNLVARFFVNTGHEVKATLHDAVHDREWRMAALISAAAVAADVFTTCRAFQNGLHETNPIYNNTNNCGVIVTGAVVSDLFLLSEDHALTDWSMDKCQQRWGDDHNCKHVLWAPLIPQVAVNSYNAWRNECHVNNGCLNTPLPALKPQSQLIDGKR